MSENIWLTKQVKTFDFSLKFKFYPQGNYSTESYLLISTSLCSSLLYAVQGGVSFGVLRNTSLIVTFKIRLIFHYY